MCRFNISAYQNKEKYTNPSMHVHMHAACMLACMHMYAARMLACMHMLAHMLAQMLPACMYVHARTCTYMHVHARRYACIMHVYMYIYIMNGNIHLSRCHCTQH